MTPQMNQSTCTARARVLAQLVNVLFLLFLKAQYRHVNI